MLLIECSGNSCNQTVSDTQKLCSVNFSPFSVSAILRTDLWGEGMLRPAITLTVYCAMPGQDLRWGIKIPSPSSDFDVWFVGLRSAFVFWLVLSVCSGTREGITHGWVNRLKHFRIYPFIILNSLSWFVAALVLAAWAFLSLHVETSIRFPCHTELSWFFSPKSTTFIFSHLS